MRNRRSIKSVSLIGIALLVPITTLADTATLSPTRDNTLYEPVSQEDFQDTSNALGRNMFTGKVKDAQNLSGEIAVRRAVIHFDVAGAIPPGATINGVQLTLVANKVKQTNAFDVALHRLLSDWGEGTSDTGNSQQGRGATPTTNDPTWHHTFYSSQLWSTPGGDYSATISASSPVGNTGTYVWGSTSGMVADVQLWLDNASQNYGWIIIGDETQLETAKRFATVNNTQNGGADRPSLLVDYTPTGGPSGACCDGDVCTIVAGIGACSAAYQGDGTNCTPNPCTGPPTGACCGTEGTCIESTQANCEAVTGNVYQGDGSTCATVECPIQLTPYVDALPLPPLATPDTGSPGATAEYTITMVEFEQQAHSELPNPTRVWGYTDGLAAPTTPGPVIVARENMPVTVNWVNDIRDLNTSVLRTDDHYLDVDVQEDEMGNVCIHGAEDAAKTVVHLHGGHVPAAVDGYPEDTFLPGDPAETYIYPNGQQAGTLWFHDHALGITRLNVYMGLAGAYLMRDSVEDAINIPGGDYEIPLIIQDRQFNPDGSYKYPSDWQGLWFGDKVMVNGKVWPFLNVKRGKYRFRLLNGSGSRVYTLSLSPPSGLLTFTVIGTEGGLLEAPVPGVGQLTIGPGERYEVVVDFENYSAGDEILLGNSAGAPFPNGTNDVSEVMKFVVTDPFGDTDSLPNTLRSIERIDPAEAVMTRDFRLKRSGTDACGRSIWEINNLHWDDITEYPQLGTTEIWRFINDSGVSHPMHMHLVFFQILDRDGFTTGPGGEIIPDGNPQPPLAEENGWKDTAMVGPNEIVRVIARFEDYLGKYAYHCHILEHEDHEMMRQFRTVPFGCTPIAEDDPTCDGIDDDCDGVIDNGFPVGEVCTVGVGECQASGELVCTADGSGTECDATPGTPQAETCDGLDNDCDGVNDNGFPLGDGCTVGVGECQASGELVCSADGSGTECDATPGTPQAETCDGLDNDCDGVDDNGFPVGDECTVGVGECEASGEFVCTADGSGTECDATPGTPQAEICDGLDNDCDGVDDNGFPVGEGCTVGVGECQASGELVCTADGSGTECDATPGTPQAETCDGLDNDCDGVNDNGFPLGDGCTVGVGECQASGELVCTADGSGTECDATPGTPQAEICDGLDNDCDGVDDNGFPVGDECAVGVGECEASGEFVCTADGSGTECDATPGTPQAETCDGLDNDCDGVDDNGFPVGEGCTVGVGECQDSGELVCTADGSGTECDATPGTPQAETCDGLDNDCDGVNDNGFPLGDECTVGVGECEASGEFVCTADGSGTECDATPGTPQAETCDGLDNDCDGVDDNGFPLGDGCTVGVGECQASGELVCTADGSGTECDATPGTPQAETCDGLDNDCDGIDDNGFPVGDGCTVGVGECQASGELVCTADGSGTECDATPGTPQAETCDGLDNDCDGVDDNGFPVGDGCTVGVGECEASGALVCTADGSGTECDATPGTPQAEICDGLDNDCDGVDDNGFDADQDTVADCFDNCPTEHNTDQANQDGDIFGDVCDCAPQDPSNAPPGLVGETVFVAKSDPGDAQIQWSDEGQPGIFGVYRGLRDPSEAFSYNHVCFGEPTAETTVADAEIPPAQQTYYYLISRIGCGESGLGDNSSETERPNPNPCLP